MRPLLLAALPLLLVSSAASAATKLEPAPRKIARLADIGAFVGNQAAVTLRGIQRPDLHRYTGKRGQDAVAAKGTIVQAGALYVKPLAKGGASNAAIRAVLESDIGGNFADWAHSVTPADREKSRRLPIGGSFRIKHGRMPGEPVPKELDVTAVRVTPQGGVTRPGHEAALDGVEIAMDERYDEPWASRDHIQSYTLVATPAGERFLVYRGWMKEMKPGQAINFGHVLSPRQIDLLARTDNAVRQGPAMANIMRRAVKLERELAKRGLPASELPKLAAELFP